MLPRTVTPVDNGHVSNQILKYLNYNAHELEMHLFLKNKLIIKTEILIKPDQLLFIFVTVNTKMERHVNYPCANLKNNLRAQCVSDGLLSIHGTKAQ